MITLDEVINKVESAWVCPSSDESSECCELMEVRDDILHYLKEYRAGQKAVDAAIARYDEAVKNCKRAEGIYKQKQKAAEDALWICKEDKDDLSAL